MDDLESGYTGKLINENGDQTEEYMNILFPFNAVAPDAMDLAPNVADPITEYKRRKRNNVNFPFRTPQDKFMADWFQQDQTSALSVSAGVYDKAMIHILYQLSRRYIYMHIGIDSIVSVYIGILKSWLSY